MKVACGIFEIWNVDVLKIKIIQLNYNYVIFGKYYYAKACTETELSDPTNERIENNNYNTIATLI